MDDPHTIHYVKWDERRPGVLRGCPSLGSERYVLKHEFEQTKGNIHKRINEVDNKHDEKHNNLNLILHTFIEQQRPLGKTLSSIDDEVKKLNNTMGVYDKRVTDIEYSYKDHNRRLSDIEDAQKSKHKSNTQIIVALIGLIGGLGSAAFGLAQFFF